MKGWYGVDLDGTLAHYDGWKGEDIIGPPIPVMVEQIKKWLSEGITVKIMTARVSRHGDAKIRNIKTIQDWLEANDLPRLDVTCKKDMAMIALFDDRAYHVLHNDGRIVGW